MGISGLRKWTTSVVDTLMHLDPFDHLYVDFNGIIYDCLNSLNFEAGKEMDLFLSKTEDELDEILIARTIEEIKKMVSRIRPSKTITLVMDGVTPVLRTIGKHYYLENVALVKNLESCVREKYGKITEKFFDKTKLSVCSPFMFKLSNKIRIEIANNSFGSVAVSLNDSGIPGEGEHKIMDMINLLDPQSEDRICIFGNDSDIIILSLLLKKKNIFFQFEDNIGIIRTVCIDHLYEEIFKIFNDTLAKMKSRTRFDEEEKGNVIDDFCFLTFLLGNDCIYKIPSLTLQQRIDKLITPYCQVFIEIEEFIVKRCTQTTLNNIFLIKYLEILGRNEQESLIKIHSIRYHRRLPKYDDEPSEYEKEINNIENIFLNPSYKSSFCPIDYRYGNWKIRYNQKLLRIEENYEENLRENCKIYFEAIIFYVRLYFDRVTPWNWYKKVYASPLASDLSIYLKNFNVNSHQIETGEPLNALTTLLITHGRRRIEEIPTCMRDGLMDSFFDQYYSIQREWFTYEKDYIKEIELITPKFDISRFQQVYEENKHLLSDEEKRRFNLD